MQAKQLRTPGAGDTVVTIHTNFGDIKALMLPEYAKKAVKNFTTHAKDGYYNDTVFHRVINNFMIQGGDPTATGCGGKSIYGGAFEDEFHPEAHNLRGALSMANSGPNTNGSQFFIVQAKTIPEGMEEQMENIPQAFSKEIIAAYKELGGTPWLDFRHTVFGQVTEGMEIVDKIAETAVDSSDKPIEDVTIIGVDVEEL